MPRAGLTPFAVSLMSPHERFLYWIRERESIRIKKESGESKPWTNDEILQRYKFCNPVRINDRVSRWLLSNWYEPYRDHPNAVLACTLARQLNNPDSLEAVGFPKEWNPVRTQEILEARVIEGLKNYSSAYVIAANYGKRGRAKQTKAYQTVWTVCDTIYKSGVRADTTGMEKTWESLLQFPGFSSFIAGQVTADLRWMLKGTWMDKDTWAPVGPGSMRGINRYYSRPIGFKVSQERFLAEMTVVRSNVRDLVEIPKMEAIDLQSCFCEFDKYERALWGEGRPKQLYDGLS